MQHPTRPLSSPVHDATVLAGLLGIALLAGCGSSGSGGNTAGIPGSVGSDPGTGRLFIVDDNQGGGALDFTVSELFWGRLVDVHQLADDSGVTPQVADPAPLFTDFVVNETLQTTADEYLLETNPITQRTRLTILARRDSTDPVESMKFDELLRATQEEFPLITPKSDSPSEPEPFSFIARNACLVLRFNDLIDDDSTALANLVDTVKVLVGQPPITLQPTRIFFDPNHGAVVGGAFHSTRVLVDATISPAEIPGAVPNVLGFPASPTNQSRPNVSIRIPTRTSASIGQFFVLQNLSGNTIDPTVSAPVDGLSLTQDVVRAMRAGNRNDLNNGFLEDNVRPELLGAFPCLFDAADPDPMGMPDQDFLIDITFQTNCIARPQLRDILVVNGVPLEVTELGQVPLGFTVSDIKARAAEPIGPGVTLTGLGSLQTRFDPALITGGVTEECWVSFTPTPAALPAGQVLPLADVVVRFSEPMDTASMSPFDNFMVVSGAAPMNEDPPDSFDLTVGVIVPGDTLADYAFDPTLSLDHINGVAESYHVRLRGVTDLAGNALPFELPFTDFTLEPTAATQRTGGIAIRFPEDNDELGAEAPDFRGQIISVVGEDALQGRPVILRTEEFHPGVPVAGPMITTPGLTFLDNLPLNPLGARTQFVWRYVDFGFALLDESRLDLDIVGMSWAAATGGLVSEFYPNFEMRLSHSFFQPDEGSAQLGAQPNPILTTGLGGVLSAGAFADNIFPPDSQMVVHSRNLGYVVSTVQSTLSPNGQTLVPYPLDPIGLGGTTAPATFTWRDTSVLGTAAPIGVGVPLSIEADLGLAGSSPIPPNPPLTGGGIAEEGNVPVWGLPLLVDLWCFPSTSAFGLNLPNVAAIVSGGPAPVAGIGFTAFSVGFADGAGTLHEVQPDLEPFPSGNPGTGGAGQVDATAFGAIETAPRWSRIISIWLDGGGPTNWQLPVMDADLPPGTDIVLEARGAGSFLNPASQTASMDASTLDPHGDFWAEGTFGVNFFNGDGSWKSDLSDLNGARFIQLRLSFMNNIATRVSPTITSLGLPFTQ